MKTINKLNLDPVATFPQIARELGENEGAIFETYRRALVKLQVASCITQKRLSAG